MVESGEFYALRGEIRPRSPQVVDWFKNNVLRKDDDLRKWGPGHRNASEFGPQ